MGPEGPEGPRAGPIDLEGREFYVYFDTCTQPNPLYCDDFGTYGYLSFERLER